MAVPEFQSGDALISTHPHQAFDAITSRGYSIWFRFEQDHEMFRDLHIQVRHKEAVVAIADFTEHTGDAYFYNQNVSVHPGYRRQGMGTAIYVFAEKLVGKTLCNFWGDNPDHQSPEVKAMWANPERPFGPQAL